VRWLDAWPAEIRGVVVGNEVLDAMPVKLLRRAADAWHERGGDTTVQVQLGPSGTVAGRLLLPDGITPAAGAFTTLRFQSQSSLRSGVLQVTTGPAITYWNPANKATGNYTIKATFNEAKYMNLNDHPHPYGIVIAGNDMGTPDMNYLYCAAWQRHVHRPWLRPGAVPDERPSRRGRPFGAHGCRPGSPVTQEIAMSVKGDKVECAINGRSWRATTRRRSWLPATQVR
jgi:hypothetical protein